MREITITPTISDHVVSIETPSSVQAVITGPTNFPKAVSQRKKSVSTPKVPIDVLQPKQIIKKNPALTRFVIIAKVASNTDLSGYNRKYFENLVDFKNKGPVVKSFRINEGKVIIEFLDKSQCEDALNRIRLKPELTKCFTDVYIPSASFPAIVDMYQVDDLDKYPSRGEELKVMK